MLRPATLEDAFALARLQTQAWRVAYRGLLPQPLLDALSVEETAERWVGYLSRGVATLVLDGRHAPLGFAGYGAARGPDEPADTGEVYALYLHPRAWGRGHGRVLFAACREALRADGYDPLMLWVLRANRRARAFYRRQGLLQEEGERTERLHGHALRQVRYGFR